MLRNGPDKDSPAQKVADASAELELARRSLRRAEERLAIFAQGGAGAHTLLELEATRKRAEFAVGLAAEKLRDAHHKAGAFARKNAEARQRRALANA